MAHEKQDTRPSLIGLSARRILETSRCLNISVSIGYAEPLERLSLVENDSDSNRSAMSATYTGTTLLCL